MELLLVRAMKTAEYFCTGNLPVAEWRHYGMSCFIVYVDIPFHTVVMIMIVIVIATDDYLNF